MKEMIKHQNARPTTVTVEKDGWGCRIDSNGSVVHRNGSLVETWRIVQVLAESVQGAIEAVLTGGPDEVESQFGVQTHSISVPWTIQTVRDTDKEFVNSFEKLLNSDHWDLSPYRFDRHKSGKGFNAEVVDTEKYSRTSIKTLSDRIRVYPKDELGISKQLQIYACTEDSFGGLCTATEVEDRTE